MRYNEAVRDYNRTIKAFPGTSGLLVGVLRSESISKLKWRGRAAACSKLVSGAVEAEMPPAFVLLIIGAIVLVVVVVGIVVWRRGGFRVSRTGRGYDQGRE